MDVLLDPRLKHLDRNNPGDVIGVYMYGSAAAGGLRPYSDIDLLALTRRSLTLAGRKSLVALLLSLSGWSGHAERFPDAAGGRPFELTTIVIDEDQPWTDRPRQDFQYGEWLRRDLLHGHTPAPADDPDVMVIIALSNHQLLRGPALRDVVGDVPPDLLRQAVLDVIPLLLEEVEGDERNALLTLARILVPLNTGTIVSKDAAAAAVRPSLAQHDQELMEHARAGYLGLIVDDWTHLTAPAAALARKLASRAGMS